MYSVCIVCVLCGECVSPFNRLKQRRCSLKARVPLSVSDSVCVCGHPTVTAQGIYHAYAKGYFNIRYTRIPTDLFIQT